jgi:thiol-disulfide isomerase/thioredoxin
MEFIKKHTTKIIVGIIIAAIVSAVAYLLLQPQPVSTPANEATPQQETTESENTDVAPQEAQTPASAPGSYVDYSPQAVEQAQGVKILFFHAPWCPQCRALEASIKDSTLPDGVTIFKVDYDSNQELRQRYGVTLQTTLVRVDDDGNKVSSYVAYDTPTFDAAKTAFGL